MRLEEVRNSLLLILECKVDFGREREKKREKEREREREKASK